MSDRARTLLACVVLAGCTLAAFSPVRHNEFVSFDDPRYITANEQVQRGLTWDGVAWAFTTTHAYNWHPLTWLSHMLDVELFGLDPGLHHLSNVVRHAVAAVLLLLVLQSLTGVFWPSTFVAFVFALHPLRVESVAWASERKDVLGALFWILTMAAYAWYTRRPGRGRYGLLLGVFVLGLLAKPMLVTLPLVLLLLDFWPLGRLRLGQEAPETRGVGVVRLVLEKLPLLAASTAASTVTMIAQQGVVQSAERFPMEGRWLNALLSYARYLGKLVWPEGLAVFYPWRSLEPGSWEVWSAAIVLLLLTVLAFANWRRGYPVTGWLWYLGTLVPVIGLVQVGIQSAADRYSYLPSLGVILAVTWGAVETAEKRPRMQRPLAAAGVAVLAVLGFLTREQTQVWRDDETLYRHAVEVTQDSYWAHYNLGRTLLETGRAAEARPHFEEAVRLEPTSREAWTNLGVVLERAGRDDEALNAFRRAADLEPGNRFAVRHLTRSLVKNGRLEEAESILGDAVRGWPEDPELHYTLGLARLLQNRPSAAIEPFEHSLRLDPERAPAHNALGIALARSGDGEGARRHFERAVELDPGYEEARRNLERMRSAMVSEAP